jgi:hypothetical protein
MSNEKINGTEQIRISQEPPPYMVEHAKCIQEFAKALGARMSNGTPIDIGQMFFESILNAHYLQSLTEELIEKHGLDPASVLARMDKALKAKTEELTKPVILTANSR